METTDKELLQRIADKDERAFNELYRRYSRLFLSWVYSRLHDRETTRDVVQEFWEEIWSRPDRFHCDEKGSAKKIFIQFLAFRAINYVKSSLGRSLGSEILLAEAEVSRSYDHVLDDVSANELIEFIEHTLATLPRLSRQVFDMQTWQHFTVRQTAIALGISDKTVRDHYNSVLITLRSNIVRHYGKEVSKYRAYTFLIAFLLGSPLS